MKLRLLSALLAVGAAADSADAGSEHKPRGKIFGVLRDQAYCVAHQIPFFGTFVSQRLTHPEDPDAWMKKSGRL
ncbi:hypothetical protein CDD83_4959 [Cordyceps sp. RAO-2017]|nr:hypothetical protein CDD83_4959 [Cordyceps sp. RAO-2017]